MGLGESLKKVFRELQPALYLLARFDVYSFLLSPSISVIERSIFSQ